MLKDYIPWSDDYRTGIRLIDNDHRALFSTVNELHKKIHTNASLQELRQTTTELLRYANEHFEREEHLMLQYNYPDLSAHKKKHHDFIRMIYAIRKIEHENPEQLDFEKLLSFLASWLKRHIMGIDRDYIPYLSGTANRRSTDWLKPSDQDDAELTENESAKEVSVTLNIKLSSVSTLRRCARILNAGGEKAQSLEDITDPIKDIEFDAAIKIADIVLKKNC